MGTLDRPGQALVEFAIISFVLSAMLAGLLGIMVLALGSFQNNIAAEGAGRLLNQVLSDTPPIANAQAVYDDLRTNLLYDERFLILEADDYFSSAFKSALPPINRMLLSSFVYDVDRDRYRHPGAVVQNAAGDLTVLIPLLPDADLGAASGIDRANSVALGTSYPVASNWVAPVTVASLSPSTPGSAAPRHCSLAFFYPSQPGSMINLDVIRDADGRIVSQTPVVADDTSLSLGNLPTGYTFPAALTPAASIASTSRGQYGLGETYAFTISVRPFRVVFETATTFQLAPTP